MDVKVYDIMLPMRDGVRLYTRVLLPGDGRFPTVFQRTPYDPQTAVMDETVRSAENNPFVKRGYAVIQQHCRGSGGSEGICIPYSPDERSDGLCTLEWVRTLPHYNGDIYFSGGSYTASVLLMLLNDDIPDLKAVSIMVQTESMYHRNYFNGMCRSFCGFTWWLYMISRHQPTVANDGDIYVRPYIDIMKRATGRDLPDFTDELRHDRFDGFWQNDPRIGAIEKLDVPLLMTGGWFDFYCYGMCSMWEKLKPETRARSCFLMTPFGHGLNIDQNGDYPLTNGVLPPEHEAEWFDSVRFGNPYPYAAPGTFRYYMIGEDRWYDAESPYSTAPSMPLFLNEDGTLSRTSPDGGERSFVYDPDVPIHRDKHDYMFSSYKENTYPDVLSFVSEPFTEDERFFGPVAFNINVSTDCDDTAFFFRLYLVENGTSFNIVDGVTTLLHADPDFRAGGRLRLNILSQPTALLVRKGCRLRVDVSSGSDCYAPHPNTSEPFAFAVKTRIAHNTVFCGDSAVLLPKKI